MRTSLLFIAMAAVAVACSEDHQPTSPNAISRQPRTANGEATAAVAQGPIQDAKPIDQVGLTKMEWYSKVSENVPAGASGFVRVDCPAGTMASGGGYDVIPRGGGSHPTIWTSKPSSVGVASSWVVQFDNLQAGAAVVAVQAWVSCTS
jgi:hypothetical protein